MRKEGEVEEGEIVRDRNFCLSVSKMQITVSKM